MSDSTALTLLFGAVGTVLAIFGFYVLYDKHCACALMPVRMAVFPTKCADVVADCRDFCDAAFMTSKVTNTQTHFGNAIRAMNEGRVLDASKCLDRAERCLKDIRAARRAAIARGQAQRLLGAALEKRGTSVPSPTSEVPATSESENA